MLFFDLVGVSFCLVVLVFFKMDTLHPKLHKTEFHLVWGLLEGVGIERSKVDGRRKYV